MSHIIAPHFCLCTKLNSHELSATGPFQKSKSSYTQAHLCYLGASEYYTSAPAVSNSAYLLLHFYSYSKTSHVWHWKKKKKIQEGQQTVMKLKSKSQEWKRRLAWDCKKCTPQTGSNWFKFYWEEKISKCRLTAAKQYSITSLLSKPLTTGISL